MTDCPGGLYPHVEECHRAERARWVAEVEALAETAWRDAPCGCGHRADLHRDVGCIGGLAICPCRESFASLVAANLRALIERLGGEGS